MHRIIVIVLVLLSYLGSHAQVKVSFALYDIQTYQLYQEKSWPGLIELGKLAIKDGHDFFYLRMRIGIAYYEQGKYRSAISHFEQALKFNKDPLAAEYLYYSYKLSGRKMDANLVYAEYKNLLKSRDISSATGFVTGLYTETGLKLISPANSEYGPLLYAHIGAEQQLGSRLNLYHGYMRFSRSITQLESVAGFGPGGMITNETKRKYVQNEYYLKAIIPVIKGLQLIGSLHTQAIIDTIQYNNISYLAGISSSYKILDLYVAYGASRLSENIHHQISAGTTFYPAISQNFYLQSILTYHKDAEISNIVFYQKIGLKTGDRTWLEFYGSFGDMKNMQELDGFYIYNMNNHLNMRLGLNGIFLLGKNVKLFVGYTNESYSEFSTELPYKQHYLFTGLQVHFKK
jgi:tetratricopeptide (TPR) repeat protein